MLNLYGYRADMNLEKLPPDRGPPSELMDFLQDVQKNPPDCVNSNNLDKGSSLNVENLDRADNEGNVNLSFNTNTQKSSDNEDNRSLSDDHKKRQEYFDELARNKYRVTDPGPYFVYVEHSEKKIGRLFPIRVGHYLYQSEDLRNNVKDIVSVGINRVKIVVSTYSVANRLVDHPTLLKYNLRSYIPTYFTQKKGVVKLVDTTFDLDYLRNNIHCEQEIVDIKRLQRRVVNKETGKEETVDRQMIQITFLGSTIPSRIRINFCIFPVEPWVHPVVKCFSCLRFGHVASQCKGKSRCSRCGAEGHSFENCLAESFLCIHCSSDNHHANSRKCPAFVRQQNIKKIMAVENVSFKEAEYIADNPSYAKIATYNRFAILNNEENFPSLPKQDVNTDNNSFLLRKPKSNSFRPPSQIENVNKRKAVSPTLEMPKNAKFDYNTHNPRSAKIRQIAVDHPNETKLGYARSQVPFSQQSRPRTNNIVPPHCYEDYMIFKKELLSRFTLHFDSLIKKIIPEEIFSHADTRNNINQFYASLQSLLDVNLNTQNAPAQQ